MDSLSMTVVARIRSDFPTKFGIPRQSGLVEALKASVIFEPEYRNPDALRGLEGFSHLWLIWQFSEAVRDGWSPTVRPPRLGGNTRMGVFATRSPFRPNPIGLSCVRLERVEQHPALGPVLLVSGADLMDGTPILDLKPYLPYADCRPEASCGWRWNCRSACGRWYRRRSERHCWAYWPVIRAPPTSRTPDGSTAWISPGSTSDFLWRGRCSASAGSGPSHNYSARTRRGEFSRGASLQQIILPVGGR